MLPILKLKQKPASTGVIIKTRAPDAESEDDSAGIEACMASLISAVHSHDVQAASNAIKDAYEILSTQDSSQENSVEPHSYDSQKVD